MVETIQWTDAGVVMIDQTRLPREQTFITCRTYLEVADAIKTMVIRGGAGYRGRSRDGGRLGRQGRRGLRDGLQDAGGDATHGGEPVLGH
jgi:methylthioribose-1-phosphate isomerase